MSRRSIIPQLPRTAWVILGGDAVSAVGGGLVLPFLVVYLHRVRGLDLRIATLALSMLAVAGLIGGPVGGALIDRIGARRALIMGLWVTAVGTAGIAFVHHAWQAFLVAGVEGFGGAMMWPGIQSMLSNAVDTHQRSSVYSVHFAILNGGFAVGGLIGGFVANVTSPRTFEMLYLLDALSFLFYISVLMRIRGVGGPAPSEPSQERAGYREVFRDKVFVRVWALMSLLVMIGYAQIESAFPAFATGEGGISTRVLGIAFAANTLTILLAQLFVLRKLEGARRTRAVVVLCGLWGTCWLMTIASGALSGAAASVGFVLAMTVFAAGETLLSPSLPALVNDLAPEHLRGRYNASYTLSWSTGHIAGPALAGLFLSAGLADQFFFALVVGCVAAAFFALRLERLVPAAANRISDPEKDLPSPPEPVPVVAG